MRLQQSGNTGFLTGVLSLRGILAWIVATSHTAGYTLLANYGGSVVDQPTLRDVVLKILCNFNTPVIFFVISGLAIGRSLERKAGLSGSGFTYTMFIMRRVLRLYPAHIAATLGIIGLAYVFLTKPPVDFSPYHWLTADFYADWLNGKVFNPLRWQSVVTNMAMANWSMNVVTWSLYVEICAIPLLPILYSIARADNALIDVCMIAGLTIITLALPGKLCTEYLLAFYLGMVIQTHGPVCARAVVGVTGSARRAAIVAGLAMLVPGMAPWTWQPALVFESFAAFMIVSLIVHCEKSSAFRLLDHRWLRWNGRLSYSFYLWHYIFLTIIVREIYAAATPEFMGRYELLIFFATAVTSIAAAMAIAQASYSWIEEPFIALGVRVEAFCRQFSMSRPVGQNGAGVVPQESD